MSPVYDKIGVSYDMTRKADPEIVRRLYHNLQLKGGAAVLDIGCGTGNYTIALNQMGLKMTGVDISLTMLESARTKEQKIIWIQSDARRLPFEDSIFNGAVSTLVVHHYEEMESAFREAYRVLKKGGRYAIFTTSPMQMQNFWLVEYFPEAMKASCKRMPSVDSVTKALRDGEFSIAGCETFMVQPNLQDLFLYSGKYKPEIYLDPSIQRGISTFASLASEDEIRRGCQRLSLDIESGKINDVISNYSSVNGDYVFIVAQKNN